MNHSYFINEQLTNYSTNPEMQTFSDFQSANLKQTYEYNNFESLSINEEKILNEPATFHVSKSQKTPIKCTKKEALQKARLVKQQKRCKHQAYVDHISRQYYQSLNDDMSTYAVFPEFRKHPQDYFVIKRQNLLEREVSCSNSHLMFSKMSERQIQDEKRKAKAFKRLQKQLK